MAGDARQLRRMHVSVILLAVLSVAHFFDDAASQGEACPSQCQCSPNTAPTCNFTDWNAVDAKISMPISLAVNDTDSLRAALSPPDTSALFGLPNHTMLLTDSITIDGDVLNGSVLVIGGSAGEAFVFACSGMLSGPAFVVTNGAQVVFNRVQFSSCPEGALSVASGSYVGLRGCQFLANSASMSGGALSIGGTVEAMQTLFESNTAFRGGAVAVGAGEGADAGVFICTDCTFSGSSSGESGGTFSFAQSAFVALINSQITGSSSGTGFGGAVFIGDFAKLLLFGCTVSDTTSTLTDGGFAYVMGNASVEAIGTSFRSCRATRQGGISYLRDGSRMTMTGCITQLTYAGACGGIVSLGDTAQFIVTATRMSQSSVGRRGGLLCGMDTASVYVASSSMYLFDAVEGAVMHGVGAISARFIDVNVTKATGRQSGGAFVLSDSTSVSILRGSFRECRASTQQGGFALIMADAVLNTTSCTWANVSANDGGGLVASYGLALFRMSKGKVVDSVVAGGAGGAFYVGGSSVVDISESSFSQLSSEASGGFAYIVDVGLVHLSLSSIANTISFSGDGGAVAMTGDARLVAVRTQITFASAPGGTGGLIAASSRSSMQLTSITAEQTTAMRGGCIRLAGRSIADISRSHFTSTLSQTSGGFLWAGDQARVRVVLSTVESSTSRRGFGGIFMITAESQLFVSDSFFKSGSCLYSGGFLYGFDSAVIRIQSSRITKMWAQSGSGGAISFVPDISNATALTLQNVYFSDNSAAMNGGCLHVGSATRFVVNGSVFMLCTAGQGDQTYGAGGGMYINFAAAQGSKPGADAKLITITQNSFVGNSAALSPGVVTLGPLPLTLPSFAGNSFSSNWSPYESDPGFSTPIARFTVGQLPSIEPGEYLAPFNITALDYYGHATFVPPIRPVAIRLEIQDADMVLDGELLRGFLEDSSVTFSNIRITAAPGQYSLLVRSGNRLYDSRSAPFDGSSVVRITVAECSGGRKFGVDASTNKRGCLSVQCPLVCHHGGVCAPDGSEFYCKCRFGWTGPTCSSPMILVGLIVMLSVVVGGVFVMLVSTRQLVSPLFTERYSDAIATAGGKYRRAVFVGGVIVDIFLRSLDVGIVAVGLLAVTCGSHVIPRVPILGTLLGIHACVYLAMMYCSFGAVRALVRMTATSSKSDRPGVGHQESLGAVCSLSDWRTLLVCRRRIAWCTLLMTLGNLFIAVLFGIMLEEAVDSLYDSTSEFAYLAVFAVSLSMFGLGVGRVGVVYGVICDISGVHQSSMFAPVSSVPVPTVTDGCEMATMETPVIHLKARSSRTYSDSDEDAVGTLCVGVASSALGGMHHEADMKDCLIAASTGHLGRTLVIRSGCHAGSCSDDEALSSSSVQSPHDEDTWMCGGDIKLRLRHSLLDRSPLVADSGECTDSGHGSVGGSVGCVGS
eukprot:Opistho-2@14019